MVMRYSGGRRAPPPLSLPQLLGQCGPGIHSRRALHCQLPAAMDDGDLDFSNPDTFLCPAAGGADIDGSCSMESYFDDILKDTEHHACTHTHTCNPPVHDHSHTHTCVHVHTKIVSAPSDAADTSESPTENNVSKKRPSGNRAAVRKYREKKKAHTASLEEEVVHLRALNQQLMKKLQNHAALEAEVARLRCLLVDIRGRIEGEIGNFPYQSDQLYCSPGMQVRTMGEDGAMSGQVLGQGACDIANIQCTGNAKSGPTKLPVCGGMSTMPVGSMPNAEKN
ncbi:hypothetical protein GUJ93_ZPchr0012g20729 [Zizania palustris]|uniref:BZIP domain-containing protein n=1 Tax=Zizania palustris TaxID=103762 RepID=A0A8J5WR33_ZIZPA|nr:hypothetical protein GUJ93_ZPchr0012g20729 [Zizania palustris]